MVEREKPIESNQQKSNFREIASQVKGLSFTTTAMRAGIVVGDMVSVNFVGRNNRNLLIGFRKVLDGIPAEEQTVEEMELFKRYEYRDPTGVALRMRVSFIRFDSTKAAAQTFYVESNKDIKRIKKEKAE